MYAQYPSLRKQHVRRLSSDLSPLDDKGVMELETDCISVRPISIGMDSKVGRLVSQFPTRLSCRAALGPGEA